jgi:hypothetical protein
MYCLFIGSQVTRFLFRKRIRIGYKPSTVSNAETRDYTSGFQHVSRQSYRCSLRAHATDRNLKAVIFRNV